MRHEADTSPAYERPEVKAIYPKVAAPGRGGRGPRSCLLLTFGWRIVRHGKTEDMAPCPEPLDPEHFWAQKH
jgi:hypothetical protein